jgi:hypothetical protein
MGKFLSTVWNATISNSDDSLPVPHVPFLSSGCEPVEEY